MGRRKPKIDALSRRERQIMDIVYRRGRASVGHVLEDLPDPPSYSAVRALMRVLEGKGHLRHEREGPRYVYLPTVDRRRARGNALAHLVNTFFGGSASETVAALLDARGDELTDAELDRLSGMIERARKEGR